MLKDLPDLPTESQHPDSKGIDRLSTLEILRLINRLDAEVASSIQKELGHITATVDRIASRIRAGGRLFYSGAGTSGRLGVLDASECPPTFQCPPEMVQGIIAGGDRALRFAVENAEDSSEKGQKDLEDHGFNLQDSLVGIAASGRTPYVLGAIDYAKRIGGLTVGLTCARDSPVSISSDIPIAVEVGPEVLTGSTRMRAGTATKMVLNMISTGIMIRLGYVYDNLMVNVEPTNSKLEDRARRIITKITDASMQEAAELLAEGGSVRAAIVMKRLNVDKTEADRRLREANGSLRIALGET
jgi:N-acetylmuramic acid 6-phosphate etherase